MRISIASFIGITVLAHAASAHQQPTTLVALDVASAHVAMSLHVPLSELELAFGHDVDHKAPLNSWDLDLRRYLTTHIRPVTPDGRPWSVRVLDLSLSESQQPQSGAFREILVHLDLKPPPGAPVRDLLLNYDVILHQVVTHKVLVSVRSDWASGRTAPTEPGMIYVDTGTSRIDPFPIHLGQASWWAGFTRMVALGSEHIREGLDHLLFLVVLLLPATLTLRDHGWSSFAGTRPSLLRLVRIVTAFTIGHSLTLIAGAIHLVRLPQQPVEILIACSVLVTAVHAIHPIFPGREPEIAAGFGLVHGLAFANALTALNLEPVRMALSIFGFNLGIELTQLFVVAVTIPWLILLSLTPAHRWVRCGGAVLAGLAAIGWLFNRVTGQDNAFERIMTTVTQYAPLGILFLACIAVPAYLFTRFTSRPEDCSLPQGVLPQFEGEVTK